MEWLKTLEDDLMVRQTYQPCTLFQRLCKDLLVRRATHPTVTWLTASLLQGEIGHAVSNAMQRLSKRMQVVEGDLTSQNELLKDNLEVQQSPLNVYSRYTCFSS